MRSSWYYLVWGLACYLFFLLAALPAQWAYGWVEGVIKPARLTGISGTLWAGEFQTLEFGKGRVGPGQWRVRLQRLLSGRLGVDFSLGVVSGGPFVCGQMGLVGVSALFLQDLTVRLQLEELKEFVPWLLPGTKGRFQGRLEELIADESGLLALRGQGEVAGLHLGSPLEVALGDLTGEAVTGDHRGLLLRMAERESAPLRLQATLRVQPDGQYRLRGMAAVKNLTDERLAGFLRMMGTMDPKGQVNLNESGKLPGFL